MSERGRGNNGNRHHQAVIDHRRMWVARFLVRGFSVREIAEAMASNPITRNPDTGKPWALGTIHNDCVFVRESWRQSAKQEIADRKARVQAEYDALRREAWASGNYNQLLELLAAERKLWGLDDEVGSATRPYTTDIGEILAHYLERLADDARGTTITPSADSTG